MTQNYDKSAQDQSGKNTTSDKNRADQDAKQDAMKSDAKKSEQVRSPDSDQQYRQNGNKVPDQGGGKHDGGR